MMKKKERSNLIVLVSNSLLLFLIIFSSSALIAAAQSSSPTIYAYITNSGDNTVSVIDIDTGIVAVTVPVGNGPQGVAISLDGTKVYVTNFYSNTTSVINTATNSVVATIPVGTYPKGVAVTPDGKKVYVADSNVSIIDTATNTVIATVKVGNGLYGIAVTPDGTRVYVVNSYDGTVSIIDTATNAIIATVSVEYGPYGVVVTPDGTKAYVANQDSNTASVIDTVTNTVIATVPVGVKPRGVTVSPDGSKVYVTNFESDTVSVIDTTKNTVKATIPVGFTPGGVAITPDGTKVYVADKLNSVSVINTATNVVVANITVGNYSCAFGQFIGSVPVRDSTLPIADFITSVTSGYYPLSVHFTDLSQNLISRSWDVNGDGIEDSSEASFDFEYVSAGTYTAKLTAINKNGAASKTATINVLDESSSSDDSDSSGGSSHSSGGSGGTGGSPEKQNNVEFKDTTKVFIPNEKLVCFNFTNDVTVVESISFESKKTMGKTTAIVENLKNKSTLVSELPKDIIVYKYFNVWVGNAGYGYSDNIRNASIYFKVNNTWIQARDINQSSIVLNKYDKENKEWIKYPVTLASEDKDCMYFTANIPGFYSFAITGTPKGIDYDTRNETIIEDPTPTETVTDQEQHNPKKKLLPFIIVGIVIVGIALVLKKKIGNNEQLGYYETIKSGISSVFGWIVEKKKYIIGKIKDTLKDPEVSTLIKALIIAVTGGLIATVIGGIIVLVVQIKYFS